MENVVNYYLNIGRATLLLALFFVSQNLKASPLSIAILDTGFCLKNSTQNNLSTKIKIKTPIDLTGDQFVCQNNYDKDQRRYHGQKVLDTFLATLGATAELIIHPFVIFDKNGIQNEKTWDLVMSSKFQKKYDLIISAAGLPLKKKKYGNVYTTFLLASGQVGRKVKKKTLLYPQNLAPKENLVLFGSYERDVKHKENFIDTGLLNKERTTYYFKNSNQKESLSGSSRAVAIGAAKAINLCKDSVKKDIKKCLREKRKTLRFVNSKVKAYTY